MRNGVVKRGEIVKAKGVGKLAGGKWSASRWRGLRRVDVKGGQKVQRVALQKCGTQWLVDTVIVGRRQGCM
jgi:hypothetical protein